ncbi:MAG: hypothetical protein FWB98_00030 [Defluviitaleaceae bacterium]|nr:hypothetical protein [Defluviitaleaceae bacterium]
MNKRKNNDLNGMTDDVISSQKIGSDSGDGTTSPLLNRPHSIAPLKLADLIPYNKHPFKIYEGQRLQDMIESIRVNGIISPPIVRPYPSGYSNQHSYNNGGGGFDSKELNGKYEILSGHNRINAARIVGYTETPCIVVGGLTEDEAHLYVTESNLVQRSFTDLAHSERAAVLASHYEAMKGQGKRNDLVNEIQNMILNGDKAHDSQQNETSSQVGTKLGTSGKRTSGKRTSEKVGAEYGIGKSDVARYIRMNSLNDGFKRLLDGGELSTGAAHSLSFLSINQLNHLYKYIMEGGSDGNIEGADGLDYGDNPPIYKISMKQAEQIKYLAINRNFDLEGLDDILAGKSLKLKKPKKPKRIVAIKIKRQEVAHLIGDSATDETVHALIMEALAFHKMFSGQMEAVATGSGANQAPAHLPRASPQNTSPDTPPNQNNNPSDAQQASSFTDNPIDEPTKEDWDSLDKEARANINASLDAFFSM